MNKPMNSCSLCGQCTVTCPNGFDMSQVCKSARENMVSTDKMPLAPHEFALMDMLFSNSDAFPFLHVNTTWKFKEMIEFRDKTAKELWNRDAGIYQ